MSLRSSLGRAAAAAIAVLYSTAAHASAPSFWSGDAWLSSPALAAHFKHSAQRVHPPIRLAQSSPNWSYGYVPTAAQWNAAFAAKQDVLGYTPLNRAGDVMEGRLVTFAPSVSGSGFRLPPGVAPGSPVNGDMWTTSSGVYVQINGSTIGPLLAVGAASLAATAPISLSFPAGVATFALTNGASVANPGTGTPEMLLPYQSQSGASKAYGQADLFKKTARLNSGTPMTDTFPASSITGMANGTRLVVRNVDASASITITAGAGTVMPAGGSTEVVGPSREVHYEYDGSGTWRHAYNSANVALLTNNLSDLSNASTARTNLGLGTAATQNTGTSGANVCLASGACTFSGTVNAGTLQDNGNRVISAANLFAQTSTLQSNPTGTASTVAFVMMGLGLTPTSITPTTTGRVLITINGDIFNATAIADGAAVQIRYGTGTAPTNGAAVTGTACGAAVKYIASTTAGKVPFSISCIATGLALATPVWIDAGLEALVGGTGAINDVNITANEI